MPKSPYSAATQQKLKEIIRLAEARLSAQLTLGVAADQRAMTFASFLAAVAGAAIAGLVTLKPDQHYHWSLITMVIGFAIAAVFALLAAQPVAWDIPGARPDSWKADIPTHDTLHNGMAAMAEFYDEMIVDNDRVMASNASLLRVAMWVTVITLFVAGAAVLTVG